jgi:UDP-glucuronate decarboxylase
VRILVTGHTGFIGSHFCDFVKRDDPGVEVIGLSRGSRPGVYRRRIAREVSWTIKDVFGDLNDPCILSGVCEGVDVVVNFAAKTFVDHSIRDPQPFLDANVLGAHALMEEATRQKVKRFVQVGTDEVYGQILRGQYREDAPLTPRNPYAWSKACADLAVIWRHRTYGFPGIITRCENNFGCYSDDTEILTRDGFVPFPALQPGTEVATLNPVTHLVAYEVPKEIQCYEYSGDLVRIKARQLDLLVTPNHRLYVANRESDQWRMIDAAHVRDNYKPNRFRFKLAGNWVAETPETVSPFTRRKQRRLAGKMASGYEPGFSCKEETAERWTFNTADWVEFMGWYLSEGCVCENLGTRGKNCLKVRIRQTRTENIDDIVALVTRMGLRPTKKYGQDGYVHIHLTELGLYLRQFGKAHDKFVPQDIRNMGPEMLRLFLHTYGRGDGSFARAAWQTKWKKRLGQLTMIGTVSKRMRDHLQEIAMKLGIASTHAKRPDGLYYVNFAPFYTETRPSQPDAVTAIPYAGKVYCVTTLNGIVFVRRNGKNAWCGNSWQHRQKAIPTFVRCAMNNEPLPVFGDGGHVRCWLHVLNHCKAIWHLIEHGEPGEIYHVAGEQELTNLELARLILRVLGQAAGYDPVHPRSGSPTRARPQVRAGLCQVAGAGLGVYTGPGTRAD